jgi:DHA1 family tetracycline resistance protein-like MFS transporter
MSRTLTDSARQVAFGLTNVTKAMGYAMIVDLSHGVSATARIHSFGSIGLAIGIGHAIGPLLGGLLGAIDPRLTYVASGSVMVR